MFKKISLFALPLLLAACSSGWYPKFLQAHKIDIDQGNVVTSEQVGQLQPGMSKEQVRFLLGTPLLVDVFHAERWEYLYYSKPGKEEATQRRLSLIFSGNTLQEISGEAAPESAH